MDPGNNRILIWNTLPTSNQQPASIVIGQSDMTSNTTACSSNKFESSGPIGITVFNNKIVASEGSNPNDPNRILIWNSIPTTNGVAADVVLGQADFATCNLSSTAANTFHE